MLQILQIRSGVDRKIARGVLFGKRIEHGLPVFWGIRRKIQLLNDDALIGVERLSPASEGIHAGIAAADPVEQLRRVRGDDCDPRADPNEILLPEGHHPEGLPQQPFTAPGSAGDHEMQRKAAARLAACRFLAAEAFDALRIADRVKQRVAAEQLLRGVLIRIQNHHRGDPFSHMLLRRVHKRRDPILTAAEKNGDLLRIELRILPDRLQNGKGVLQVFLLVVTEQEIPKREVSALRQVHGELLPVKRLQLPVRRQRSAQDLRGFLLRTAVREGDAAIQRPAAAQRANQRNRLSLLLSAAQRDCGAPVLLTCLFQNLLPILQLQLGRELERVLLPALHPLIEKPVRLSQHPLDLSAAGAETIKRVRSSRRAAKVNPGQKQTRKVLTAYGKQKRTGHYQIAMKQKQRMDQ